MRSKQFIAHRELDLGMTGPYGTPDFKYDLGAYISQFQAGQTSRFVLEMSQDGKTWVEVVEFILDDATEVTVPQVYIEHMAVRARALTSAGRPEVNIWIRETD